MRLIHFERDWLPGLYSIERIFREIRRSLPRDMDVDVVRCPTPAHTKWWLPIGLLRARLREGDVNHISGDINYIALALPGRRTILTVHDVNRLDELSGFRKKLFGWLYFGLPLRHCRFVTAISNHTRDRLIGMYSWAAPKIRVIPDCVPTGFAPSLKPFSKACPRLLQVGTRNNKNLERVAQALSGCHCVLHIIGRLTEQQEHILQRSGINYENDVNLNDEQLVTAYRNADIVLFVSLAEGFGLPILEAQAIGRAVVTSDLPPMNTIAGRAACLVNPHEAREIRNGIDRVIEDNEYREMLIRNGYQNVARFTAEHIAAGYVQLYEAVLKNRGEASCEYCKSSNRSTRE